MKIIALVSLFLVSHFSGYSQIPDIIHNYKKSDSIDLQNIDSFVKRQDYVLAYREEGGLCRNCPTYAYKIIAFTNNKWTSWTFTNYQEQATFNKKTKTFLYDTIRVGKLYRSNLNLSNNIIQELFNALSAINFWVLNNDSLNQTRKIVNRINKGDTSYRYASVTDDLNYRFDIIFRKKSRVIQSYAPEFFLELFPDMTERRVFMKGRELFLEWWKKYCR